MSKNHDKSSTKEYPETLDDALFYGLNLDEEQKIFRDMIWNKDIDIVFCNAKAGTGKTTVALGVANLMYQYNRCKGVSYIISPTQEQVQGFLPGDIEDKSAPYMEPLYEAAISIGLNPNVVIATSDNIQGIKSGDAFIRCMSHTYLRGTNFDNEVVIVDECQNFYGDSLKKVLTRMHDTCKVVCIGHTGQIDIIKHPERSGFARYIDHFKEKPRASVCELNTNHRGWISTHADSLEFYYTDK